MPVDVVALAGVVTAPVVAGVVAVVIHRERLSHERRENDLRELRTILTRANEAQYEWMDSMRTALNRLVEPDRQIEAMRAAIRARGAYFEAVLALRFLIDDEHPLITASYELDDAFSRASPNLSHTLPAVQDLPTHAELHQIEPIMSRWFLVAHETARARL